MRAVNLLRRAGMLLALLCLPALAQAAADNSNIAGNASNANHSTARQAQALLASAVKYLEANGPEKAFAAFNNPKGGFVKRDLYVFAIDQQGVYRASGAAADSLVGLNVLESRDAAGNPLFRNMLDAVKGQSDAQVRYVWLNRASNKVEPKVTFLHRSGDYVLGVGYYAPRATANDARRMLNRAVALVRQDGMDKARDSFNDPVGGFFNGDLYVFAVNLESGRFEAMGANPAMTGSDARDLTDVEGHPLIQQMIDLAKRRGEGEVDYVWRNPLTNAVEKKHSFIRREGGNLVGVGYYRE